jgi:bleomycin hydrolase
MIIFNFGRCNLNMNNKTILSASLLLFSAAAKAQLPETNLFQSTLRFKTEHSVKNTEVKNQHNTSTCWSFSSLSMLESEAIREGKPAVNFSEMFIVRHIYLKKAENYVRMHGHANFGPGGAFHDVTNAIREFGIVPESVYPGNLSMNRHDHSELDSALKAYLENLVKNENRISGNWRAAVHGILDAYLGKLPEKFDFNGKPYTALSFAGFMGIRPDDYLEFTSFTHHPMYKAFVLEVPDNWSWDRVWNVSLSELKEITDFALSRNYSIAWGADVSEKGFSFKNGLALVPEKDYESQMDMEKDSVFTKLVGEKNITEEMRQMAFDDFRTQDDHGMHITGLAKDQSGKQWYAVKNSWGSDRNYCRGYFYCSVPYYQYKTTSIMVHKSGVPPAILAKLKP